jgi:riboflavin kinase/FMN adenylyltransferase
VRTTVEADGLAAPDPAPDPRGSVVSIGVFDGVHLGHQAILAANVARARELDAVPTVVTFAGHPKQVLIGQAPRTLTTLEHRLELFRRAGIEHALVLSFDESLRQVSAEEFVERILIRGLGAKAFVLGFDSKFGHDRRGTPALLASRGFDVTVVDQVLVGHRAVSSTAIREAVELGDLDGARAMLGRPVSVLGTVVRGDALGRQLGFPTANLDLHHELHPPPGVYYGRATIDPAGVAESKLGAVCNIGFRPTLASPAPERPRIEVHLLGLDPPRDLYGSTLEMEFLGRLRGEKRFADLEQLKAGIAADVAAARGLLGPGR